MGRLIQELALTMLVASKSCDRNRKYPLSWWSIQLACHTLQMESRGELDFQYQEISLLAFLSSVPTDFAIQMSQFKYSSVDMIELKKETRHTGYLQ